MFSFLRNSPLSSGSIIGCDCLWRARPLCFLQTALFSLLSTILTVPSGCVDPPSLAGNCESWIKGANGGNHNGSILLIVGITGSWTHKAPAETQMDLPNQGGRTEVAWSWTQPSLGSAAALQKLAGRGFSKTSDSAPASISSGCLHACLHPPKSNSICMCRRWPVSTTGWTKEAFLLMYSPWKCN